MRVLQIIPGGAPQPGKRDNIFIHRQIDSLIPLIQKMHIIYAGLGSRLWDMLTLYRETRREVITFKPEVIHAHYATATGAVTIMASGRIPTIVSFGGDEVYGTYINEVTPGSLRTLLARELSKFCARKAVTCIVKNEEMRKIVQRWSARHIEDIPNGVNLTLFTELDQLTCRSQLGLRDDIKYVVFAVRFNDYVKRRDLAEKAVNLCNLHEPMKVELLVLEDVDPRLIPQYLNAGDVLLLCSNHEGSPNIVKEALACNRPVVSTDVGDVRQRFSSVTGLFLVQQTPESIAWGLRQAMKLHSSNGRDFVTNLSEDDVAKQLFGLYQSVSRSVEL